MNLKESVLLALKLARRGKEVLVVGHDGARWQMMPLADPRSDQLAHAVIVTPKGLRYPDDDARIAELTARGL